MGQHYYPVPYNLKRIALYVVVALVLWGVAFTFAPATMVGRLLFNTLLLFIYIGVVLKLDMPLASLPIVGKYFKK